MTTSPDPAPSAPQVVGARRFARLAGLLYLLVVVFGVLAHVVVRGRLYIPGDAAATAANLAAHPALFRLGFVADLAMATFLLLTAMALYRLLRHVHPDAAAAMVVAAVGVAITFAVLSQTFAAFLVATAPQYTALTTEGPPLALLLLDTHHYGYLSAHVFFGLWLLPLGYLMYRSTMSPAGSVSSSSPPAWASSSTPSFSSSRPPCATHSTRSSEASPPPPNSWPSPGCSSGGPTREGATRRPCRNRSPHPSDPQAPLVGRLVGRTRGHEGPPEVFGATSRRLSDQADHPRAPGRPASGGGGAGSNPAGGTVSDLRRRDDRARPHVATEGSRVGDRSADRRGPSGGRRGAALPHPGAGRPRRPRHRRSGRRPRRRRA